MKTPTAPTIIANVVLLVVVATAAPAAAQRNIILSPPGLPPPVAPPPGPPRNDPVVTPPAPPVHPRDATVLQDLMNVMQMTKGESDFSPNIFNFPTTSPSQACLQTMINLQKSQHDALQAIIGNIRSLISAVTWTVTPVQATQADASGAGAPLYLATILSSDSGKHYFMDHRLGPGVTLVEMEQTGPGTWTVLPGQAWAMAGAGIWNSAKTIWSAVDTTIANVGVSDLASIELVASAATCSCSTCGLNTNTNEHRYEARTAIDPNEKTGASGVGVERYVTGEEPLRYVIFFENTAKATAPAREVVITDKLDAQNLDFDTLSLGPITFGKSVLTPPLGVREHVGIVDLRPAQNLLVKVIVSFDVKTTTLNWRLSTLDPMTGQPPDDPLAGFLPPNNTPPEGDGSVALLVRAKSGVATGTAISNGADIVFDTNAAIKTNIWKNTIDLGRPSSRVTTLPATQSGSTFELRWSGNDQESGLLDYAVWVSKDGGPFEAWQRTTTNTSGSFTGETGRTYRFYSIARDKAGNEEQPKASPEATTTIAGQSPTGDAGARTDGGTNKKSDGGGCGCRVGDTGDSAGGFATGLLFALATVVLRRRKAR